MKKEDVAAELKALDRTMRHDKPERIVLSSFLIEIGVFEKYNDLLKEEHFADYGHQLIFRAIKELNKIKVHGDILTVTRWLRSNGFLEAVERNTKQSAAAYISQLTNGWIPSHNLEFWIRILLQEYIRRTMTSAIAKTYNDLDREDIDLFDILKDHQSIIDKNVYTILSKKSAIAIDILGEKIIKNTTEVDINKTGFPAIDDVIYGWNRSDLIVIAARPGVGKTAFGLSTVAYWLEQKRHVTIASLEMSAEQLLARLCSIKLEIDGTKFRKKNSLQKIEEKKIREYAEAIKPYLTIIDDANITPQELKAKILRQVNKCELLVVDYIQLMKADKAMNNREQEVSSISRELKVIAKDLDIPLIAFSQLNRAVENRKGTEGRPQLSDLRESGAIEQDADEVIFLWRPDMLGYTADKSGNSITNKAKLFIAKNRHGPICDVTIQYVPEYTKFIPVIEFNIDDYKNNENDGTEDCAF